ncbi:hypothetical protein M8756_10810 [Lutimaribacter sp. EGI FJ00015]|uniref:Uncharacterized protein n=1 Tax=Lutimaribacter degradans TaxID=2945989 RepID=A0ACC5ZWC3_9RHOB|nr:hypothetical protein [Lutimaribacter sp. EGI FJ00013]MCM2562639.1 hypothetical protein [Lutimaribacter sp. EGI FJ00013]MCO0613796.1 hypothetical protein [Lutimaribacter sp. EGI FJ00015]MCO0636721.1 hypothetical protein [Lutimaribacter sp. EGI FJ00014]
MSFVQNVRPVAGWSRDFGDTLKPVMTGGRAKEMFCASAGRIVERIYFGRVDAGRNLPEDAPLHYVIRVTEDYAIDHWMHMRSMAQDHDKARARMDAVLRGDCEEDKQVLGAIHEEEQRPQTRKPVRIAIDKAPNVYSKRIRDLVDAETSEYPGEPERPTFVQHD